MEKRKIRCICVAECHLKHESPTHVHYLRGELADFYEVPLNFEAIEEAFNPRAEPVDPARGQMNTPGTQFDFSTASEELLLAADFDITDMCRFAGTHYNVSIPVDQNKAVMVAKFVDARYRYSVTENAKNQATTAAMTTQTAKGKK